MTQNGPQADDGRDRPVIVRDAKHAGVATGGLPMIQVKMDGGKPQVQTVSNVQGGPPQIPAAAPTLSAPRGARVAAPARQVVAAPSRQLAPSRQVALPTVPDLSTDQLMLCRHLAGKYLGDLLAESPPTEPATELPAKSDAVKLAEATIFTLDEVMIATAVRAAAAEEAATVPTPVVVPTTQTFAASTSIAPAPSASYVAGRVGSRPQGFTLGARTQRNSAMAPRRVARAGSPLPPVIVKMEGRQAVVQNKAEVEQAKAAMSAPETTVVSPEAVVLEAAVAETPEGAAQG